MKCLVIDFGATLTKYCLMDENITISEKGSMPSPTSGKQAYVDCVVGLYKKYTNVDGVALSMPGMLDNSTGYARTAGFFLDLGNTNIFGLLRPYIPVPIAIENDGKCGALSELWKGSLKDYNDSITIIIGSGLAGGIIKDKKLHRGSQWAAGEFSLLMVQPGNWRSTNMVFMHAGMMGFMMKVGAAKGIALERLETAVSDREEWSEVNRELTKHAAESKAEGRQIVDGRMVFEWLEQGDPDVEKVYKEFVQSLALVAFNLQMTYDPEAIAIGGGVSRQPRLIPDIQKELDIIRKNLAAVVELPETKLVPCKYLNDAGLVGAMYNFLLQNAIELLK